MEFAGYDDTLNRARLSLLTDAAKLYLKEPLAEPVQDFHDRPAVGDFVVEDDDVLAIDVADDGVEDDAVVAQAALAAGGDRKPQHPREMR